ncbi:MAG TPA: hypothetical protein ENJ18_07660 [Nannocystis exedens]|nr:hypothetical protein [Nannocystis exedens]
MDRFYTTPLGALSVLLLVAMLAACNGAAKEAPPSRAVAAPSSVLVISQRQGKLRDFPCQQCHVHVGASTWGDGDAPRKHRAIKLDHFQGAENCGVCHDAENRDRLHMLNGTTIGINESYTLCGQCHSEKLRDWTIGAHGKHVGGWKGVKHRLVCADCHDPHAPGLDPVIALPAPPFPELGIAKGHH